MKRMAILKIAPPMLRKILQLPDHAEVLGAATEFDSAGMLGVKIQGAGWYVSEGGIIGTTTATVIDDGGGACVRLDWGFPPNPEQELKDLIDRDLLSGNRRQGDPVPAGFLSSLDESPLQEGPTLLRHNPDDPRMTLDEWLKRGCQKILDQIEEDLQVEATTAMQRASVPAGVLNPELARQVQALQDLIRTERRNGFRAAADVWAQCGEFFEDDKQIDSAVEIYLDDSKRMDDADQKGGAA